MNNSIVIHSFDVFDTLITRPFIRPVDVFVMIGNTLVSRGYVKVDPQTYRDARARAERRARAASRPRDDCRWNEIFLQFPELAYWGVSADEAMQLELDAERCYCSPIAENVEKARSLLKAGEKVLFLSDMYLPTDFICELICSHVADCAREDVYVSGELGLSKHTGRLYTHVIERYGIAPSQLRHFGDNSYADVEVPTRLGIPAVQYRGVQPTHHERLPRPRRYAPLMLSAMRGTARAARLQKPPHKKMASVASIATSVVAPVLTAFVAWVLQNARERKIDRLYFVSRDGQILLMIASALRRDGDPECRYLYGSRQAWFLPSVQDLGEDSLNWAWLKGMSRTVRDILRRLEIYDEPILSTLTQEGFDEANLGRQLDDIELKRIQELIRAEPIASIVLERARARRTLLLEYLGQEGCFDGTRWALVDIGWELNCQKALNQLLKIIDHPHTLTGYYFGVSHRHMPLSQVGVAHPFIAHSVAALHSLCNADWLFRKPTRVVVDHFFVVSDHESVCRYCKKEQQIEPIYVNEMNKEWRVEIAKAIHSAVQVYTESLTKNNVIDPLSPTFRECALSEMKRFCLYPRASEVQPIALLPVNFDQTHGKDHWETLVSRISMQSLLDLLLKHFHCKTGQNSRPVFLWLAGSAAISSWPVRIILISGSTLSRSLDSLRFLTKRFFK
jgi:FMN phosphatase YigB (HAD superfamily)